MEVFGHVIILNELTRFEYLKLMHDNLERLLCQKNPPCLMYTFTSFIKK